MLFFETVLLGHNFVEGIGLEIEHIGEGAVRVDLIVLEGIEVEADSLQVYDKDIWSRCDHVSLLEVNLPVAAITLIVVNDLALNLLLERLFNRFEALDWNRKIKVVFHAILHLTALRADHLTALLASEDTLDEMLARGWFKSVFKSIEKDVEELLGVLLL